MWRLPGPQMLRCEESSILGTDILKPGRGKALFFQVVIFIAKEVSEISGHMEMFVRNAWQPNHEVRAWGWGTRCCQELIRAKVSLENTPSDNRCYFHCPTFLSSFHCTHTGGKVMLLVLSTEAPCAGAGRGERSPAVAGPTAAVGAAQSVTPISASALTRPDQRGLQPRAGSGPGAPAAAGRSRRIAASSLTCRRGAGRSGRVSVSPRRSSSSSGGGSARRSPLGTGAGASGEAGLTSRWLREERTPRRGILGGLLSRCCWSCDW